MDTPQKIEVVVRRFGDSWIAICVALQISAVGETPKSALQAFQKALISTVNSQLNSAMEQAPDNEAEEYDPTSILLGAPAFAAG